MIIRKSAERGKNKIAWLDANHTFSFGNYRDPKWTNFNNLLVINEDTISPAMGFGTHPHDNMEIITYIIDGSIKHRDSMGSVGEITPGEIQIMSAGTGVTHSEFNGLEDKFTHLLQIWVLPNKENIKPRYDQRRVYRTDEINFLKVIAGIDETDTHAKLNADAQIWLGKFNKVSSLEFRPQYFKNFWIQIVKGEISIGDKTFSAGDGLAFSHKDSININTTNTDSEFLILELADY
ncbi:MAG: pirin family protein [Bdellovibrionales bacterium]|nr:pirin family protein [Bdellovibrionales bacterium]